MPPPQDRIDEPSPLPAASKPRWRWVVHPFGRSWPAPGPIARQLDAVGTGLTAGERRLVEAAADAFFPRSSVMPLSGTDAGLVAYFERYLALCRPFERVLLHVLLHATNVSPLAFGPSRRTFSGLEPTDRLQFLRDAFGSRIYLRRIAFTSLRALMTMGYLAHPEVARHLGIVHQRDPFGLGDAAPTPEAP